MWYLRKEYNTGTFTKDLSRAQLEEISKLLPFPNEFAEKIKEVKEQLKKIYNIGSNKFNYALEIIRRHREFSSYMGEEKVFSCLSDNTMKIFAECSLGTRNWKESSSKISINELNLCLHFLILLVGDMQKKIMPIFLKICNSCVQKREKDVELDGMILILFLKLIML